ncbi:UNVERIFIED_ORG: O-acetyl-ADP-ribose deacetylase (regulator of RNase III) [Methylobacterium sp. SuP10 SLI 274]|uniref:type II toxin-antitoxin system antitoxin DNA ADP-ribosyl glycohydrolase DarG n=1 Tax=Methylorubrum extorquens TaxID=408 RepID=UPI0020A1553A|nr:macro domain-containing protein [Methylorubrum extorquens]MDF9863131.1 O-acetyl-ADP-ribose deacetylase (regulator of RNase III) [Methylorubrum pseudosasae]MDH6636743.1 O-acetyl-ADP-ribose deacetylase (regulator of RNase III) [Methylobacterium sp. SuP10 SLI 274]MDH6665920.1 O-acetyl-ADP-ribose deacetylase (regulator of RNase III) [Methylorubrum zatmanii]MCP1557834.1 O-acetyl-ADP-ribose deacetylase (regulator of RNase III) [Methylorubrum extorquens]MDF9791436.1 O-acetyl-ADP-ribose deacetylase
MSITITDGDLLSQKVDAIVNTVNCVGVMGKGIALQFKRKWPANFRAYEAACKAGDVVPGRMFIYDAGGLLKPQYIINFPTKRHWRGKSEISFIAEGLKDLVQQIEALEIKSIAVPPLGCGNGGLDWDDVRPLIEDALGHIRDLDVRLFAPGEAPIVRNLAPEASPLRMTPSRAAMVSVLSAYRDLSYPMSRIEVQKLAYFLERAGEPLGLSFVRHTYGPYSDTLRHVLTRMDGAYITGVGDQDGPSEIRVLPNALSAANEHLDQTEAQTRERVERVARLIEGFQTPYAMELLATVHWVATEEPRPSDLPAVVAGVHAWNARKREIMSERDIGLALEALRENGWLQSEKASEVA